MRLKLHGVLLFCLISCANAADLMSFWDVPQSGANSFNRIPPDQKYFNALHNYGASWVRLTFEKWKPAKRDFLIGNADRYNGLNHSDLAILKASLDRAHKAGLKVVITPISIPGGRWRQQNGGKFDSRVWKDKAYWKQNQMFWQDLAKELKAHPAVAAYNLVNEPAPEFNTSLSEHATRAEMMRWYQKEAKGTTRDLPNFYQNIVAAIRKVDAVTPIMLDSGWYAAADTFAYWPKPLGDQKILYSFHMYEPYQFTSVPNINRAKPYPYPGGVPYAGKKTQWDAKRVADYLQMPMDWAKEHKIPASRMVVGEFGCMRRLPGCGQYLEDVLKVLDSYHLHWAFYSFREDTWDGMDYELGKARVPWAYWKAMEKNQPDPLPRSATPAFEPIRKRLATKKTSAE